MAQSRYHNCIIFYVAIIRDAFSVVCEHVF